MFSGASYNLTVEEEDIKRRSITMLDIPPEFTGCTLNFQIIVSYISTTFKMFSENGTSCAKNSNHVNKNLVYFNQLDTT